MPDQHATQDRVRPGDVVLTPDGRRGEVIMYGSDGGLLVRDERWYQADQLKKLYHRTVRYDDG